MRTSITAALRRSHRCLHRIRRDTPGRRDTSQWNAGLQLERDGGVG